MRTPSTATSDLFSGSVALRLLRICVCGIAAALAFCAAPALAAPTRNFDTELAGLTPPNAPVPGPFDSGPGSGPWSVAIGPADSIWITNPGESTQAGFFRPAAIFAYDAAGGYLGQQTGGDLFTRGYSIRRLALDTSTGYLYVVDGSADFVARLDIFDNTGAFVNKFTIAAGEGGEYAVAVDNSGGPSQGRIYTAYGSLSAFEPNATSATEVHEFSASGEPYISGNHITGTPAGGFGNTGPIATDTEGNIYLGDRFKAVDEFRPSGEFVQEFTGAEAGGFGEIASIAVDPTNGNVLVLDSDFTRSVIDEFDSSGKLLGQIAGTPTESFEGSEVLRGIVVDSHGFLYAANSQGHVVDEFLPVGFVLPEATTEPATEIDRDSATLHATADPAGGGNITACRFSYAADADYRPWEADPYAAGPSAGTAPCLNGAGETVGTPGHPIESETGLHAPLNLVSGTTPNTGTPFHWRISLTNANGTPRHVPDQTFQVPPAITELETDPVGDLTQASATLNASFTAEEGLDTSYYFEYGTSTNYGHKSPAEPGTIPSPATGTQTQDISTAVAALVSNTTYHFRVVAENKYGVTLGEDREFTTFQPPTIESFSTSHVTATSADLEASINPQGFETECHFEYGQTIAYGLSGPCPDPLSGTSGQPVEVEITGLQSGVTYHFRVLATNVWGTVTSEDQTFEFFPPGCPNAAVRQQTGSAYLPDCRAYELVSPGDANGTLLFSGGPNPGTATGPSRFAFVGAFSSLPGVGNTIGTDGDLYVATRTETGWTSRYIGLQGNEAGCMAGPPNNPWSHATFYDKIQNPVLTDPGMDRFLDWSDGTGFACFAEGNGTGDGAWALDQPSNAPYLWNSDGTLVQRLPTGLNTTAGAPAAFVCPTTAPQEVIPHCSGDVAASGDLRHFVFSSNSLAFAAGGLAAAPGSAYDDNLATGAVTLISTLPGGKSIPQDSFYATVPAKGQGSELVPGGKEEFIRFPAVSSDGSHILMSTATAGTDGCENGGNLTERPCPRFTDTPVHLYMSIDDAAAVEIAPGHAVNYVGVTPDGSKVYFTSPEQLHGKDTDASTDLYMWSQAGEEEGRPLTLISKASPGSGAEAGDTDNCTATWTSKCSVLPYSGWSYAAAHGGAGGNGTSDSAIASAVGDIYFYSPEQLDGDRGVRNQQNLYDYREGRTQYVTTLAPGRHCQSSGFKELACTDGPIARLQVTPDDSHMAFVTEDRLTSYDNDGHLEMYSYTPSTGALICNSCNPSGQSPTADVAASQDGLFLTDDGRTFFSTVESLTPQDTNDGTDVYEFVNGRPQLITPGTGTASIHGTNLVSFAEIPGLVGVSANGTDVYFSTFDSLIPEDHNGNFLKFYDARTSGGFPQPPPRLPCAAAEECHGPGTTAPELPIQVSNSSLTGGNATPKPHRRHRRKHHKKATKKRRAHRAGDNRGGKG